MLAKSHLADAAHRSERGPQLVRGIRREAAELLERPLEPGNHIIENGGQLSELVDRVLDG